MDGILLIDKPPGLTSAEVVRRIKARVKPERVGHLGTLDPFASGLLPIVIGEATKLAAFLEAADKEYTGVIQLGVETDTLDRTGLVTSRAPLPALERADLARVEAMFVGELTQTVPVFSAVKFKGERLYELARKGIAVVPPSRGVKIQSLRLAALDTDKLRFELVCAKGTYARALARDIGQALGSVAFLSELRRIRSAGFSLDESSSLDQALAGLERISPEGVLHGSPRLVSMSAALADLPEVAVDAPTARRVVNGDSVALAASVAWKRVASGQAKVLFGEKLIAIAEACEGRCRLLRVFPLRSDDLYSPDAV